MKAVIGAFVTAALVLCILAPAQAGHEGKTTPDGSSEEDMIREVLQMYMAVMQCVAGGGEAVYRMTKPDFVAFECRQVNNPVRPPDTRPKS